MMLLARGDVRLADFCATFTSFAFFCPALLRPLAAARARFFTAAFLAGRLCLDFPMRFPGCSFLSLSAAFQVPRDLVPVFKLLFFQVKPSPLQRNMARTPQKWASG